MHDIVQTDTGGPLTDPGGPLVDMQEALWMTQEVF